MAVSPYALRDQTADETTALLAEALAASPAERQRLHDEVVTSHLWLAESLSRKFLFRGEDADDLLQVARIGLVEACQRYQPDRGSFVGFAVPTINGVLKRHFRDHVWAVRPPRRTQELAAELWRQWPILAQRSGSIPSQRDLAGQLAESVDSVGRAQCASQSYHATSIEAAALRGSQFETDETALAISQLETRLVVDEAMAQLDDGERELLRLRFYEMLSQAEIAAAIGTSQMQVSRLLSRLMRKLRLLIGQLEEFQEAS